MIGMCFLKEGDIRSVCTGVHLAGRVVDIRGNSIKEYTSDFGKGTVRAYHAILSILRLARTSP